MTQRIFLPLFFLFLSIGAAAQDNPRLSTTGDEVVVTGTRFPRSINKTTTKVTVIDSAEIARNQDFGQLLNEQAGIVVNGIYSAPGKDRSLFLRNGANQFTLLLLDGQPLIDPSSLGGPVDLRLIDLQNIERIEILRGAQSLIYGSDAVAGVINLISKKGSSAQPFNVTTHVSAGSFGTVAGGGSVVANGEKLSFHAGYDILSTIGLSEATPGPDVDAVFGRDGARRQSVQASLSYRPNEFWTIRPSLRYATFDGDYDDGSFQDADNTYNNELLSPALAVDYANETYSAGLRYNYVSTDREFKSAFGTFPFNGRAQQADAFATKQFDFLALTLGAQVRTEELRLDAEDQEDPDANTISPYLQTVVDITDKFQVEAGARYTDHSNFGSQFNYSLAAGYTIGKSLRLRATYASAYQSPTLDQLAGPFGANPDLAPQVSTSAEIGLGYRNTTRSFSAEVAVFRRDVEELIIFTSLPEFPFGRYQNENELQDQGIEFELAKKLTPAFSLTSNFTYVKGELTTFSGDMEFTNDEFFRRPRVTGFLGVTYTPTDRLLIRISENYTGRRPDLIFNPDFTSTNVDLDAYWLTNLYAEYQLLEDRNLTVFTDLRNLTNTDFVEVSGFTTQGLNGRVGARMRLF